MEFDFSKLWAAQFFGFYKFKSFFEFASDKNSQINYYKQLGAIYIDEHGETEIETPQQIIDSTIEENKSTLDMIKNQIIVYLFTRYEFIIQDAMKCLICDDPEKISKFLKVYPDYEKFIGFSLAEFVRCKSKEEYITTISERLSLKTLAGKPSNVIKRLKSLLTIENINTDLLDELMFKRNNIVHEGEVYEIGLIELETYYNEIDNLLKVLALALKNINISVIDTGGLLTEY